jgi:hypothetical protein
MSQGQKRPRHKQQQQQHAVETMASKLKKRTSSSHNNENKSTTTYSFENVTEMSATEYLANVSQQAKTMPSIFFSQDVDPAIKGTTTMPMATPSNHVATSSSSSTHQYYSLLQDTFTSGSAASISYLFSPQCILIPAPSSRHVPCNILTFSSIVIENFERLRTYLEQCQEHGVGGKNTHRLPVPPLKCREWWDMFCVGSNEDDDTEKVQWEENTTATVPQSLSIEEETLVQDPVEKSSDIVAVTPPLWKENLPQDGFDPTVRLLLQMDQVMIRRVLFHLAHYVKVFTTADATLNSSSSSSSRQQRNLEKRMEWIHALLARLEKPVHRDDAAGLQSLLRDLCLARSKIDCDKPSDQASLKQVNGLIVLIGIYFEQANGLNAVMSVAE